MTKLLEHGAMQNGLVRAQRQGAYRIGPGNKPTRSRFDIIVDERHNELGAVSQRYKLTQPHDLLAAVDLLAEEKGIKLDPTRSHYRNGKALFDISLPEYERRDPTDRDVTPTLSFGIGMGGVESLWTDLGMLIGRCSNGMVIFRGEHDSKRSRNTAGLDIMGHLWQAFESLDDGVDRYFRITSAARQERFNFTGATFNDVREEVGQRSRKTFDQIVVDNRQLYGDVVWAAMQAITELQTHHTGTRKDGSLVWTSRDWARRQLHTIVTDTGVARA